MQAVPKFKIYDDDQSTDGVFDWGKSRGEIFELFYNASEQYNRGEMKEAKAKLEDIISKDQHFIDAYNQLSTIEMELGDYENSIHHQQKAVKIGEQIVPDSFEGQIRWGFTENRPYLRALHAAALNYAYEDNFKQSISLMEDILAYNPNDNQGIRYLIGDFYFLQNQFKNAAKFYKQNLDYPPYLYSYGLLHVAMGNRVKAITQFRKGIMSNIYISEYLRMNVPLIPYDIWHATNYERPETAYDYLDFMLSKWVDFPEALDLLQFLHVTKDSHDEIEKTYMLKQQLKFDRSAFDDEESQDIRKEILNTIEDIKQGITDASSKELLKQWKKGADSAQKRRM